MARATSTSRTSKNSRSWGRRFAIRALRSANKAVIRYLPRAAAKVDGNAANVHQLRVCCRRAATALKLFQCVLPRQGRAWWKKQLRRIRKAANEARDFDVIMKRLEGQHLSQETPWRDALLAERLRAQEFLEECNVRFDSGAKLKRRLDKLLAHCKKADSCELDTPFEDFAIWAKGQISCRVERFFHAVPTSTSDLAAIHRFRVQGKKLRYAMLVFQEVVFDRKLSQSMETIQDRLGKVNDHAVALRRLTEQRRSAKRVAREMWEPLIHAEQQQLERAVRAFWRYFTPAKLERLRARWARAMTSG